MEPEPERPLAAANGEHPSYPAPRRLTDEFGEDYRGHRRLYGGNGGNGGSANQVITAATVSLVVGVLVVGVSWLGFMRSEIDRTMGPVLEDVANLQSAHGRLDDRISRELQRLDNEKVDDRTRVEMIEEWNRRLDALERSVNGAADLGRLNLEQVNELRQRVRALESRLRMDAEDRRP